MGLWPALLFACTHLSMPGQNILAENACMILTWLQFVRFSDSGLCLLFGTPSMFRKAGWRYLGNPVLATRL